MTGEPSRRSGPARRRRGRPPHPDILTPREWQVLDLLRQRLTNEQMAQRLDISYATAKYHVAEIISKLGVQTREQAAAWQQAVAVRWWQRATAWLPRRAWPIAGAVGAMAAVAGLAWIVFGASAGEDDNDVREPPASTSNVTATPALPPQPQPLGRVLTPLSSNAITEEGSFIVDLETGQIWSTSGFEVWSPDGTKMFRTLCCSGESGLDVVDFATGNAVRILDEQVYALAWSPDGSQIAYSRFNGSSSEGIYLVEDDGSQPHKVLDFQNTGLLKWSQSGTFLTSVPPPSGGNAVIIRMTTGEIATVLESVKDLAWSPNDDVLAYGTPSGLFLLDVGSEQPRQIDLPPFSVPRIITVLPRPSA